MWGRPGLDVRSRSIATVAILVATGKSTELATHLRGAQRLGIERDELFEFLVHCSAYVGMPATVEAVRVLAGIGEDPTVGVSL